MFTQIHGHTRHTGRQTGRQIKTLQSAHKSDTGIDIQKATLYTGRHNDRYHQTDRQIAASSTCTDRYRKHLMSTSYR